MPLAANALTTVENVMAYAQGVGEAIPPEHAISVEFHINALSKVIEKHCRRKFGKDTYTSELHTGKRGQQHLYPRQWPINSVTSVKLNGTAVIEDTDFTEIDPAQWVKYKTSDGAWVALFRNDTWESAPMGIEITYDSGYVLPGQTGTRDLPYDVEEYAIRLVLAEYLHRGKQGISQESFAGLSLTMDRWPLDIVNGLRMERRPHI